MRINNLSDFEIIVQFKDEAGAVIPVPQYDFDLSYFVFRGKIVTASQHDGVLTNCSIMEDGKLHLYFNNPQLGVGRLFRRIHLRIPDLNFPDGYRDVVSEEATEHLIF